MPSCSRSEAERFGNLATELLEHGRNRHRGEEKECERAPFEDAHGPCHGGPPGRETGEPNQSVAPVRTGPPPGPRLQVGPYGPADAGLGCENQHRG